MSNFFQQAYSLGQQFRQDAARYRQQADFDVKSVMQMRASEVSRNQLQSLLDTMNRPLAEQPLPKPEAIKVEGDLFRKPTPTPEPKPVNTPIPIPEFQPTVPAFKTIGQEATRVSVLNPASIAPTMKQLSKSDTMRDLLLSNTGKTLKQISNQLKTGEDVRIDPFSDLLKIIEVR